MTEADEFQIVVVNATRIDFDRQIDWSKLGDQCRVFHDEVGSNPSEEDILARCGNRCKVLVTKEIPITQELINRLPESVVMICEAGTGYNNIDIPACRSRGIRVANVSSYSEAAVASLVITFVLSLSSGLIQCQRELWQLQHQGSSSENSVSPLSSTRFARGLPSSGYTEVEGKTIGLIGGRGNIGTRVARVAIALGMHVLVSCRSLPLASDRIDGIEYTDSLSALLERSDFVSIHCPLTEETRHLIDERALSAMKAGSYLINTARGAVVDEAALIQALSQGRIAGAAIDVQSIEPPPADSELYQLASTGRLLMTPHIGWKRLETRQRAVTAVAENISAFRADVHLNIVS